MSDPGPLRRRSARARARVDAAPSVVLRLGEHRAVGPSETRVEVHPEADDLAARVVAHVVDARGVAVLAFRPTVEESLGSTVTADVVGRAAAERDRLNETWRSLLAEASAVAAPRAPEPPSPAVRAPAAPDVTIVVGQRRLVSVGVALLALLVAWVGMVWAREARRAPAREALAQAYGAVVQAASGAPAGTAPVVPEDRLGGPYGVVTRVPTRWPTAWTPSTLRSRTSFVLMLREKRSGGDVCAVRGGASIRPGGMQLPRQVTDAAPGIVVCWADD